MLKSLVKNIIGESNLQYFKDRWNASKNSSERARRTAFYKQFISEGELYFDVGANYGNRVEAMLEIGSKVIAIEPQQECCKFLGKKFGRSIEIVNKGLGAQNGQLEFFQSDASTLSTFSAEWIEKVKQSGRFSQYNWNKKSIVEITTLDNLIAQYGKPRFVKIDVEGYELEVLKGLSVPIDYISFEYTVPEQIEKMTQCIRHIESLGMDMNTVCNFSVGESMVWAKPSWVTCSEMIDLIETPEFIASGFGDIYIRTFTKNA